jgi:uncharacterized Zn finger protein
LKVARDVVLARNALAARWLELVESHISPEIMRAGLEYAWAGQITSLHALAGEVEALVQGTAPRPYRTRMSVAAIPPEHWQNVIDAMAREAIHVAKLLAGELPPGIDELFAAQGLSLLPSTLTSSCTCAAGTSGACKHVAAAAYLLTDRLSEIPLLLFTLLGLPAEQLLERLRQARALQTHGMTAAHGETPVLDAQPAAPLESLLDDFWRGSGEIDDIQWQPPETVRHALLRRLGPSPVAGRFPMVGLLASIYDTVSQAARDNGN